MRRLTGILGVAAVAVLSGCAEDTITPVPSEETETTEADTQSFQPAQATDDRAFDEARARAMPLILKAENELDQVDFPYTLDTSRDLGHVSTAEDLVGQAGHIFEGVDDEIAGYLFSAQNHLIGAISAIGGGYVAAGATRELHAAADDIDAANELLGLEQLAETIQPPAMARRERETLEHGVHAIAEQAAKTNTVIDEAIDAGLAADHPVTVAAKQVRLELLKGEDRPGVGTRGLGA